MPAHLCAYAASISPNTEVELSVVPDDVLTRTALTRFLVPAEVNQVDWRAALSTNLVKARLYTPSLEMRRTVEYVIPRIRGATKFPLNYLGLDVPVRPTVLTPNEELSFYALQNGTAAETVVGLVQLRSADLPPIPAGDIRVVRATGSTTLNPYQWTSVKITPDVALEAGTYALVGFLPISASCIAARALIPGAVYRPGVPGFAGAEQDVLNFTDSIKRHICRFNMGTFTHMTIPEFQFLSSAADTSEVIYLYLVKTG